jgi:putative restriction endonuclease
VQRDEDVRTSCFLALAVLQAKLGDELPYEDGLRAGFAFRGGRVPFLNRQKGIYRAAAQRGPAALSIQTSYRPPYADEQTELGFFYDYRGGSIDQADNRALREAHRLAVPVVYFVATRPGWYRPFYPCFVIEDFPAERRVLLSPGKFAGGLDEPEPVPLEDPLERRYATRELKVRLHQSRFRGIVLPAYRDQCAICRLKEIRLLDAAHIVGDADPQGEPLVANGLSLCSIHHRAFDEDLVGVSPGYEVHVAQRLLEDDDGPMLDVLKGFHGAPIELPSRRISRPDPERLAIRFERFLKAG